MARYGHAHSDCCSMFARQQDEASGLLNGLRDGCHGGVKRPQKLKRYRERVLTSRYQFLELDKAKEGKTPCMRAFGVT
jgi:hypothetical protein